jgi:hypothetical protein
MSAGPILLDLSLTLAADVLVLAIVAGWLH